MVHLLAWDHSQLTAAITPTWVLFSIFSPVCSHLHGIPKLPLPTCCLGELRGVMDLFMKDDVLFQKFKVFFFREMFCLFLLPQDFKETCDYQKDLSSLLIFSEKRTDHTSFRKDIHNLKASSKTETCFIFTIRFCFFSLQLKDVSISFWGGIIIICKIENFPYKFSLLKGGWFSFIPVV